MPLKFAVNYRTIHSNKAVNNVVTVLLESINAIDPKTVIVW